MDSSFKKYALLAFRAILCCYAIVAGTYFLSKPPAGDELLFIQDLVLIEQQGWIAAIEKGISIPYMVLCYPFTWLLKSAVALRLVNIAIVLLLLIYFYERKRIKQPDFYFFFLFFCSTVGYFFSGTNDTLFFAALIIFFTETYCFFEEKKTGSTLFWTVSLIIAFFTRELFLVFLPVILVSIFLVYKKLHFRKISLLISLGFFSAMLCFNLPSLLKKHTFSYDAKLPPKEYSVNWAQRQYYAQLLVNEGTLQNHQHPSWQQTQNYVDTHGEASLPKGILSGLTFNVALTAK